MNPLSALFGTAVALRNVLYDRGILRSRKLSRPVLSVGNISVGGSGKTPFVIALGRLLQERRVEFTVLSRGYGRQSKEIAIVDPSGSPLEFGDEPLLMARSLNAPVIVGADRYRAGLLAEIKFPQTRLHLLDDGFQHRRLHRDFDIVLLSPGDLQDVLLPVGRLREPVDSLRRAHALVNAPADLAATPSQLRWQAARKIFNVPAHQRAVAFCGLGRPQQFFTSLQAAGVELAATMIFPDHHRYGEKDVARLLQLKTSSGAEIFVTTQKDEMNLGALAKALSPLQVAALKMEVQNPEAVIDFLCSALLS